MRQVTLRQIFLLLTTLCIVLAILNRPLAAMFTLALIFATEVATNVFAQAWKDCGVNPHPPKDGS